MNVQKVRMSLDLLEKASAMLFTSRVALENKDHFDYMEPIVSVLMEIEQSIDTSTKMLREVGTT